MISAKSLLIVLVLSFLNTKCFGESKDQTITTLTDEIEIRQ